MTAVLYSRRGPTRTGMFNTDPELQRTDTLVGGQGVGSSNLSLDHFTMVPARMPDQTQVGTPAYGLITGQGEGRVDVISRFVTEITSFVTSTCWNVLYMLHIMTSLFCHDMS